MPGLISSHEVGTEGLDHALCRKRYFGSLLLFSFPLICGFNFPSQCNVYIFHPHHLYVHIKHMLLILPFPLSVSV